MEEAWDDHPLFHAVVWACCDVFLETFLSFRDGFILELLKTRNPILKGIGFAHRKVLGQECIRAGNPCGECILVGVEPCLCFPKQKEWEQLKMNIFHSSAFGLIVLLTSRKFWR
jgi:hypothetical protein